MESIKTLLLQALAPVCLLLTAPVSAFIFLTLVLIAVFLFRDNVILKWRKLLLCLILLFGGYTLFNVVDFIWYRRCGLAMSPINQGIYYLFSSPPDLYVPCATVPLLPSSYEYAIQYRHKYGGPQKVVLNLINNHPKEFEYNNPDKINLSFSGNVSCADIGMGLKFSESFTTYYLQPGTNQLSICSYELITTKELVPIYVAEIKIKGDLAAFLRQYPGSYLTIKNGTTK